MDTLIYSGSLKKDFNPNSSFDLCNLPNHNDEEAEIDDALHSLENEMLSILFLKNRKRSIDDNDSTQPSKRPKFYNTKKQYFTHPTTGKRSVMTYEYTVWFQKYIMNPLPQSPKFLRKF